MENSDDFITSFLFPNENVRFTPDSNSLQAERSRLEQTLTDRFNYSCEKCGKTFSRHSNLKRHKENSKSCGSRKPLASYLECYKCRKSFNSKSNLKRHQNVCKSHGSWDSLASELKCNKCKKTFKLPLQLKRHQCSDKPICHHCGESLNSSVYLEKHIRLKHTNKCPRCGKLFDSSINLAKHARKHLNEDFLTISEAKMLRKIAQSKSSRSHTVSHTVSHVASDDGNDDDDDDVTPPQTFKQTTKGIHGDAGVVLTMKPSSLERHSILEMLSGKREQLRWNLSERIKRWKSTRWYMSVNVRMLRYDSDGNIRDEDRPTFHSKAQILLVTDEIENQLDEAYFKVNSSLETYCSTASGWVLDEILTIQQTILKYRPVGGNCGDFTFPQELQRRGLVSVTGRPYHTRDCFIWAITIALHRDPDNTEAYVHWEDFKEQRKLYKFTEAMSEQSTVTIAHIAEFETLNRVSVNVFAWEKHVFPLYVSKTVGARSHVNLLLVHSADADNESDDDVNRHYCVITDLGKLLFRQKPGFHKLHVCPRCLTVKYSQDDLEKHTEQCLLLEPLGVTMPEFEKRFVRFRNFHLQLEAPFVIVARFETFRMPIYDMNEPTEGVTVREKMHRPSSFAYHRMSVDESYPTDPVAFVDPDPEIVMREFLTCMHREQQTALALMRSVKPMTYCDQGLRNIEASNDRCHICEDPFLPGQKVVLDHDHVSGKIRGRACNSCNLNFRCPNHIIVLMDDLAAYDGRIIMSAAALFGANNISVVPKTIDTYMSITIDRCRFVDLQNFFKGSSLDSLVQDLSEEGGGNELFANCRAHWPSAPFPSPLRRIPLCRDYITCPERLSESNLPDAAAFSDRIEGSHLTPEQYQIAMDAWNSLEDRCILEYMKLTLVTDCLLSSDIVSHFRKTVREHLKLDPFRYYSLASFAFDSALRFSGTTLELLTDIEMHLMVENAIRGGLAIVGNPRMATANNRDMPPEQYDETAEESTIDFFDFNGLYTSTMISNRLPTHGFRFLSRFEIDNLDIMQISEDADHGFILEVDLEYPRSKHDEHDDFPMAPERMTIKTEDLSPYTKEVAGSCGVDLDNVSSQTRLCLTLKDKVKYTVHYRNLQFYVSHGLRIKTIHRVITFVQSPFLESFMTFCGEKRKAARSKFYKTVWKNIANLVSGKSYENPRNYSDVRICNNKKSLLKYVSRPTFDCLRSFSENLTAVRLHRQQVTLCKPITVGFSILELSKLAVYSFYYDFVKSDLARGGQCNFLGGDTDSMIIKITGVTDMQDRYRKSKHLFDFSNLPDDHSLKSDHNRMVPGKVKFEMPGHVCLEFLAVSPKAYSMKTDKGFKQARKGCPRELRHEIYKECLLSGSCHQAYVKEVRNYGQELYQVSVKKRVLNILDVKRYHYNATESVSFGHYALDTEQA